MNQRNFIKNTTEMSNFWTVCIYLYIKWKYTVYKPILFDKSDSVKLYGTDRSWSVAEKAQQDAGLEWRAWRRGLNCNAPQLNLSTPTEEETSIYSGLFPTSLYNIYCAKEFKSVQNPLIVYINVLSLFAKYCENLMLFITTGTF